MLKINDLLISADGTYPGIVIGLDTVDARYVRIKWYKWGYDSPDFYRDLEHSEAVLPFLATPSDIRKKFWTLPKEYDASIVTTGEKIEQLRVLVGEFSGAECSHDEYNGPKERIAEAWKALVEFYLEGRG